MKQTKAGKDGIACFCFWYDSPVKKCVSDYVMLTMSEISRVQI